jgi:hypothetical protein
MSKILLALVFLIAGSWAHADEFEIKGYIKPDPLRGDGNFLILNDEGNETGRIKSNPLYPSDSGRYLILDKKGNTTGIIRPDYLNSDRYIIETVKDD